MCVFACVLPWVPAETLFQDDPSGTPFVELLPSVGIIPGIKVDTGLKPLIGGAAGETYCSGLDTLPERCAKYYARGARFAKWRTQLVINADAGTPSDLAVWVAATDLARYARICQENGLVPIIEPEVALDGTHDLATSAATAERVLTLVYEQCRACGVLLEGSILKPSMIVPGESCADRADPKAIAQATVETLERCVPAGACGVTFLSGGISEEDASIYLNEINQLPRTTPFPLTFSFSRALQSSCIKVWEGKSEASYTYGAAQDQLFARAKANSEAARGVYKPGSQPSMEESLFVKGYTY